MAEVTPIRDGWSIYKITNVANGPMGLTTRWEILDPDGRKRLELYSPMTDNEANAFVTGWQFGHRDGLKQGVDEGINSIRATIRRALGL